MSYETRFKERALSWLAGGRSRREIARVFGVSRNTLSAWEARVTSGEGLAPANETVSTGRSRRNGCAIWSRKPPTLTTPNSPRCSDALSPPCGTRCAASGSRRKKTPAFKERDEGLRETLARHDPGKVAYLDETGLDTDIHRRSAWSGRGVKVEGWVSGGRFERLGLVARRRQNEIPAPMQYPGTMDAELFEAWFSAMLPPRIGAGRLVVMDNASFHRKARLCEPADGARM